MKITQPNFKTIEDALRAVNGKADTHTYSSVISIVNLVAAAEAQMESLGIPKSERSGAEYISQSGSKLPSAYKYTAKTTTVKLRRNTVGWLLTEIKSTDLFPSATPCQYLHLTQAQDAIAIANLRKTYCIQQTKV